MGKIRLVLWLATTGGAGLVLLDGVRFAAGDPAATTMAAVRAGAGVLAAYLFVATLAALARVRWLPSPAVVRRLVAGAVGGGLLVAPLAAGAAPEDRLPSGRPPAEAPVLRRIEPPPGPTTDPVLEPPSSAPAPIGREVTAAAGDHLWAIAERAVADRLGRAPTDDEVAPYWRAVVDANRDRLVTGDADLIFPGQTFVLP